MRCYHFLLQVHNSSCPLSLPPCRLSNGEIRSLCLALVVLALRSRSWGRTAPWGESAGRGSSCCFGCLSNEHQSSRCPCKDVGLLRAWPVGSGGGAGHGSVSSEKHSQLLCRVWDGPRWGWSEKPTSELFPWRPAPLKVHCQLCPCSPSLVAALMPGRHSNPPYPQWAVLGAGRVTLQGTRSLLLSPPFLAQDTFS